MHKWHGLRGVERQCDTGRLQPHNTNGGRACKRGGGGVLFCCLPLITVVNPFRDGATFNIYLVGRSLRIRYCVSFAYEL